MIYVAWNCGIIYDRYVCHLAMKKSFMEIMQNNRCDQKNLSYLWFTTVLMLTSTFFSMYIYIHLLLLFFSAFGENDKYASKRPLVAVCDTSRFVSNYWKTSLIKYYSLTTLHSNIKNRITE